MGNVSFGMMPNKWFMGLFGSVFRKSEMDHGLIDVNSDQGYIDAVRAAKQELESVERLFNTTADPDLIEYAIYEQYAASLRFSYLIKKAKERNIRCADYILL